VKRRFEVRASSTVSIDTNRNDHVGIRRVVSDEQAVFGRFRAADVEAETIEKSRSKPAAVALHLVRNPEIEGTLDLGT
jgi:hypothetical protein